jgi:hypothetical protein
MTLMLTNGATALLAGSIDGSDSSLAVATGAGSRFPTISEEGDWFPLVVVNAAGGLEIMRATARSGDVITVTRAQEGTSALAFDAGARVDLRLTAAAIADIITDLEAVTAAAVTDLEGKLSAAEDASLLFPQATAELGWVQDTDVNDRLMRVVDGEGGGTGGTWTITGLDVGNTTLTTAQIPAHAHASGTLFAASHAHGSGSYSAASHSHSYSRRRQGSGNGPGGSTAIDNTENLTTGSSGALGVSGSSSASGNLSTGGSTANAGGGDPHDHPISHDGEWRPAYMDCIRAVKQAA